MERVKKLVGGVAQWLERRSLTGKLSLIYTWSMVGMWPLCRLGVCYGSTNQANSAFHPFGVSKWAVIHVITRITEVETIKRQAGTVCSCLAVRLARVCGLSLQPTGCTSSLACDVQRYCSCSCRLRRYISVMPLHLCLYVPPYNTVSVILELALTANHSTDTAKNNTGQYITQ